MGDVIQMHTSRAARAQGAAVAVAIAANRLGLTPQQVIRCAQAAAERVKEGQTSAARAVSDAKAELMRQQPRVIA